MKKMINTVHIEGLLYDYELEIKKAGENAKNPGTIYIRGKIDIATDDKIINIVPVYFTYVTATTKKGESNRVFNILNNIIEGKVNSVMKTGAETAAKISINTSIGLNEFYDKNDNFVSVKRNEGGFIDIISGELNPDEKKRNTFKVDMLITGCIRKEAVEEKGIPERVIVRGAIFNYKNELLPVEFTAINQGAMNYFEGLGASNKEPIFTNVWGRQISETIITTTEEESAFGDSFIREHKSTRKDFVITGAIKETYIWDSDETITATELTEAMSNREIHLATLKQQAEQNRNKTATPSVNTDLGITISTGSYKF